MNFLLKFAHGVDKITDFFGKIATWLVLITVAVGFYNVVARYIGKIIGMRLASNVFIELQWYLFSLIFFCGFPYILKHGSNVRVDFLYANWNVRRQTWIDFLGTLFFLIPFCILGIYATINPVMLSWGLLPDGTWGTWEVSGDADGLPRAPIKSMIIVSFVLLLAQSIAQAIKYLAILTGHTEVKAEIQAETEFVPVD